GVRPTKATMMITHIRAGTTTKRAVWFVVVSLLVAALTTSGAPLNLGFAFMYMATALVLNAAVRLKNVGFERFVHVFVLAGSAPVAVRTYFGSDLGALGLVHVMAVLIVSIGVGYLVADRIWP